MKQEQKKEIQERAIQEILGYLNFSSGARDVRFFTAMSQAFESASPQTSEPRWKSVVNALQENLAQLALSNEAFKRSEQASRLLAFVKDSFIADFRAFHYDLLFHHTDDTLVNAYFLARVFEVLLALDGAWDDLEQLTSTAISELNDIPCLLSENTVEE